MVDKSVLDSAWHASAQASLEQYNVAARPNNILRASTASRQRKCESRSSMDSE